MKIFQTINDICLSHNLVDVAPLILKHIYINLLLDSFQTDDENDLPFKVASQKCIDDIEHFSLSFEPHLSSQLQKKLVQWRNFQRNL